MVFVNDREFFVGNSKGTVVGIGIDHDRKLEFRPSIGYIAKIEKVGPQIWIISASGGFRWSLTGLEHVAPKAVDISTPNNLSVFCLGMKDGTIEIVDSTNKEVVQSKKLLMDGFSTELKRCCWSPNDEKIGAITSIGNSSQVHLVESSDVSSIVSKSLKAVVRECCFTPDGNGLILVGSHVLYLDCKTHEIIELAKAPADSPVVRKSLNSNPDYFLSLAIIKEQNTTILFSGTADGEVWSWALETEDVEVSGKSRTDDESDQ